MDPNKALEDLRNAIRAFRDNGNAFNRHWDHEELLVNAAEALDEWLTKGGFLPKDWASLRFVSYGREEYRVIEAEFEDSSDESQRYTVWVERNPEYDD